MPNKQKFLEPSILEISSGDTEDWKNNCEIMTRGCFSQTSILKKLNAKCEKCGISACSKDSNLTIDLNTQIQPKYLLQDPEFPESIISHIESFFQYFSNDFVNAYARPLFDVVLPES